MNNKEAEKIYGDIINLPHHKSNKHPSMSCFDRAAQFLPFAALTGHSDVIKETGRLTEREIVLDEDIKAELDFKISILQKFIEEKPEIEVIYYTKDKYKDGGKYKTLKGCIKKINLAENLIVTQDGTSISIQNIVEIMGEIFESDLYI